LRGLYLEQFPVSRFGLFGHPGAGADSGGGAATRAGRCIQQIAIRAQAIEAFDPREPERSALARSNSAAA
jgi:hypothetical protein